MSIQHVKFYAPLLVLSSNSTKDGIIVYKIGHFTFGKIIKYMPVKTATFNLIYSPSLVPFSL